MFIPPENFPQYSNTRNFAKGHKVKTLAMKLRGTIMESLLPTDKTVIIRFHIDPKKQHFEVKCSNFNPYAIGMRKWDSWDLVIKFESEIFIEPKTENKSYFTHLVCTKATLFHENGTIGKDYR